MAGVETTAQVFGRRRGFIRVLDSLLFAGAVLISAALVAQGLTQPLSAGRVLLYVLLAPAAAIVIHRGLAFLQRRRPGRALGIAKWLGSPVAALLLCAATETAIQARGLAIVRTDLDPVVRRIEAQGPFWADIREALGSAQTISCVDYFPSEGSFVLATPGGSIDLDGEALYYDSRAKAWRRFHNDLAQTDDPAATAFRAATRGAVPIRYDRSSAGWTPREATRHNP